MQHVRRTTVAVFAVAALLLGTAPAAYAQPAQPVTQVVAAQASATLAQPTAPSRQLQETTAATTYTVVPGDTLSGIAYRHGTTWQAIWQANPFVTNPNLIYPNQKLAISGTTSTTPSTTPAAPAQASGGTWQTPIPGACYGDGWGAGRNHQGVDIKAGYGTPIRAAAAGTVSVGWQAGGAGNYTMINHGNSVWTVYMHQSSFALTSGWVSGGQVIGYVGSTGQSSGPHLHFETHVGGLWNGKRDPVAFMASQGAPLGC